MGHTFFFFVLIQFTKLEQRIAFRFHSHRHLVLFPLHVVFVVVALPPPPPPSFSFLPLAPQEEAKKQKTLSFFLSLSTTVFSSIVPQQPLHAQLLQPRDGSLEARLVVNRHLVPI